MSSLVSAINAAASGLDVQHVRMETAVSNIANADSTSGGPDNGPFRRLDVLVEAMPPNSSDGGATGVRVAGVVQDSDPFHRRFDPSNALADAEGYVSMPNVDVASEMVNMTSAARAYQANLTAINLIRDTIQHALDLGK